MSSISIARALVELKTLDSRINKITSSTNWILYKTKNKNSNFTEEEFKKTTLSEFQSLNDLITRRDNLKNAILKSNSVVEVELGGVKMTVSQAIEYKKTIQYKKTLLEVLKRQRQMVTIEYEAHKQRVQNKIDENIKVICGKDSKPDETVIKSVSEGITKGDPIDIFDPLGLDKVIKELETSIEDFTANVDYVLSESNALTTINV
jgi:hypothetical protein